MTSEEINYAIKSYINGKSANQICKTIGYTEHTILKYLRKNNISIRSRAGYKIPFNEDYFENIDDEKKAYLLGFFQSDGNVYEREKSQPCIRIQVHNKDRYIIELFKDALKTKNKIVYDNNRNHVGLSIHSRKMFNDLLKYGVIPNKTGKEQFCKDIINSNLLNHYIRGIFDADGWIAKTSSHGKPNKRFTVGFCGNHKLIAMIKSYLTETLSLNDNKITFRDTYSMLTYSSRKDIKLIYDYFYNNANYFLERKKDVFKIFHANIEREQTKASL